MIVSPLLQWVRKRDADRATAGLRRTLHVRQTTAAAVVDLASNDYLGLARDERVIAAAVAAARTWGAGATGSRLVTGSTQLHTDLEAALAAFVGTQSSLVFSSGYLANLGVITSLADKDTLIVSDALNHASLIDAIRLSGARVVIVPHRDVEAVESALHERKEQRALVVTEAIFSVDGDLAPLGDLHGVARKQGATLLVDEAHSLGVLGDRGQGACAAAGIGAEPDVVQTLTLSKALGSAGGAVAGGHEIVAHLINTARTFIFDTGLAPACAGAALESLRIINEEPQRVAAVRRRAQELRDVSMSTGWPVTNPDGAVVSVLVGEPDAAMAAARACADQQVLVGCFRPPSVPDGISRLRLTARATLTDAEIAVAGRALAAAAAQSGSGQR